MTVHVRVAASDAGLKRVLSARLATWPGFDVGELVADASGNVIVSLAHELPPAKCARVVQSGNAVVVLATVWRAADEQAYLAAGASAYLAMNLDLPGLARAIETAASARNADLQTVTERAPRAPLER